MGVSQFLKSNTVCSKWIQCNRFNLHLWFTKQILSAMA